MEEPLRRYIATCLVCFFPCRNPYYNGRASKTDAIKASIADLEARRNPYYNGRASKTIVTRS